MTYEAEREDLEELVATRGWRRFVTHALAEYRGEGYFARMGSAKSPEDMRVVHETAVALFAQLSWVEGRIAELLEKERQSR